MPTPAYYLSPDSIVEMSIRYSLNSQQFICIRHYKQNPDSAVTLTDGPTAVAQLAAAWDVAVDGVSTGFGAFCHDDVRIHEIRAQAIYPTRYAYQAFTPTVTAGSRDGDAAPQNITAVATVRTPFTGRHQHGNVFMAGLIVADVVAGLLTDECKDALALAVAPLVRDISTADPVSSWNAVIYNRTTPADSAYVSGWFPQDQARVMRRRTVGLGI